MLGKIPWEIEFDNGNQIHFLNATYNKNNQNMIIKNKCIIFLNKRKYLQYLPVDAVRYSNLILSSARVG